MAEKELEQSIKKRYESSPQTKKMWDELHIPNITKSTFVVPVPKETDPKVLTAFKAIAQNAISFSNYCKQQKIKMTVDISEVERNDKKRDLNTIKKMTIYLASKMNEAGETAAASDLISVVNNELRKNFKNQRIENPYSNEG